MNWMEKTGIGIGVITIAVVISGLFMAVKNSSERAERCAEIGGERVPGKYNGGQCLINGRIVLIDRDDCRQQAEKYKDYLSAVEKYDDYRQQAEKCK